MPRSARSYRLAANRMKNHMMKGPDHVIDEFTAIPGAVLSGIRKRLKIKAPSGRMFLGLNAERGWIDDYHNFKYSSDNR